MAQSERDRKRRTERSVVCGEAEHTHFHHHVLFSVGGRKNLNLCRSSQDIYYILISPALRLIKNNSFKNVIINKTKQYIIVAMVTLTVSKESPVSVKQELFLSFTGVHIFVSSSLIQGKTVYSCYNVQ